LAPNSTFLDSGLSGAAKGDIAGGVVGVLALGAIAFAIYWFFIRPKRIKTPDGTRLDGSIDGDWQVPHAAAIEPFPIYAGEGAAATHNPYAVTPEMTSTSSGSTFIASHVLHQPPGDSSSTSQSPTKGGSSLTSAVVRPPPIPRLGPPAVASFSQPQQEVDAQDALEARPENEILPPPYKRRGAVRAAG
jgi:hypothetical protein